MSKALRSSINVRQCQMKSCLQCINKNERNANSEEGICNLTASSFDGLPLRCVGEWANDKIYYLVQYFGIFANGMKNKWDGNLRYIELCSGPGRCSTRNGFEQDGTALAIVNHPAFEYLADAIFIDYNQAAIDILNQRISTLGYQEKAHATLGDYNDVQSIVAAMRQRDFKGLSLCLVDPTDCSIPFSTIRRIIEESNNKCDLIISFFDKTDFHRNAVEATLERSHIRLRQKYELFIGDEHFFEDPLVISVARQRDHSKLSELFRNAYAKQLAACGLPFQNSVPVGRFYHLLFATGSERGLDFWKKANKYAPDGQQYFNFLEQL